MFSNSSLFIIFASLFLLAPFEAPAWGPEGHAATGIIALELIDETAKKELADILGSTTNSRMDEWCNWPDAMKERAEWDWATPQHYVNIPRSASGYDAERDCPKGLCVTEAIKKYANQLSDERLPREKRAQAFGWLCHLVGDLHQPLHSGYRDDRGGNTVQVLFAGQEISLHEFWDRQLILERSGTLEGLLENLDTPSVDSIAMVWMPDVVDSWTWQSHQLVRSRSYPGKSEIGPEFADMSWALVLQQIPLASVRLAEILNATLGEGEVVPDR